MKIYKSGTIIIANYINFKGENKKGVFMVIYDEAFDNDNSNAMNIQAIKITTQLSMVGNYVCNLRNEDSLFLNQDCLASCSKIHTLHKNQVVKQVGVLGKDTYKKVYGTFRKFLNEVDRQMIGGLQ